jgi:hypothetical protein
MSKDHPSNDPWDLIRAHQYEEAVAAYDVQLAAGKEKWPAIIANRATALLCAGRLPEALEGFPRQKTSLVRAILHPNRLLENIGTVLWLMDHRGVGDALGNDWVVVHGDSGAASKIWGGAFGAFLFIASSHRGPAGTTQLARSRQSPVPR